MTIAIRFMNVGFSVWRPAEEPVQCVGDPEQGHGFGSSGLDRRRGAGGEYFHCQSVVLRECRIQAGKAALDWRLLRHHRQVRAGVAKNVQEAGRGVLGKAGKLLKAQDLHTVKAMILGQEGEEPRGKRAKMRGVEIKAGGPDRYIFRIRGFQDQEAPRPQNPQRFLYQHVQVGKRKVLGKVEAGDDVLAFSRQALERRNRLVVGNRQVRFATGREHAFIAVDSARLYPRLPQQLQPLAPAASEIDRLAVGAHGPDRRYASEIRAKARLDRFARAAKLVLERPIEIRAHRRISSLGGSQATPTNLPAADAATLKTKARSRHS